MTPFAAELRFLIWDGPSSAFLTGGAMMMVQSVRNRRPSKRER